MCDNPSTGVSCGSKARGPQHRTQSHQTHREQLRDTGDRNRSRPACFLSARRVPQPACGPAWRLAAAWGSVCSLRGAHEKRRPCAWAPAPGTPQGRGRSCAVDARKQATTRPELRQQDDRLLQGRCCRFPAAAPGTCHRLRQMRAEAEGGDILGTYEGRADRTGGIWLLLSRHSCPSKVTAHPGRGQPAPPPSAGTGSPPVKGGMGSPGKLNQPLGKPSAHRAIKIVSPVASPSRCQLLRTPGVGASLPPSLSGGPQPSVGSQGPT